MRGLETASHVGDRRYRGDPPLAGYAFVLGAFAASVTGAAALERALGRELQRPTLLDFAILAAATFKSARVLARERLGTVVREPFVEEGNGEPPEPAGEGVRRALGELVTCTRCVGTWTAAGLLSLQIAAPRVGRLVTWSLAASAANDFLQARFVTAIEEANEQAPLGRP